MIKACLNFQTNRTLLQNIVFNTSKSRKQTTPKQFRNPKLTPRGILTKQSKSYDYDLPQDLENRHLYWDRSVMNKIYRKNYNLRRLQKLGIVPIHDSKGTRLFERQSIEILRELSNLHVVRNSIGRTFENLREMLKRFPQESLQSERQIMLFAIKEIHDRFLPSMSFYHYSTFCQICYMMRIPPTGDMLVHFYKFLQSAEEGKTNQLKFPVLCKMTGFIFSRQYPKEYQDMMKKKTIDFELFQDNPFSVRSLEEIVPNIYTEKFLGELVGNFKEADRKLLHNLEKMPGGHKLREKIEGFSTASQ